MTVFIVNDNAMEYREPTIPNVLIKMNTLKVRTTHEIKLLKKTTLFFLNAIKIEFKNEELVNIIDETIVRGSKYIYGNISSPKTKQNKKSPNTSPKKIPAIDNKNKNSNIFKIIILIFLYSFS